MFKKIFNLSEYHLRENVEYILRDKDGNVKKIFQYNFLGNALLKLFRKITPNPINESGEIKDGVLNYLSVFGLRFPFLFGLWTGKMCKSNLMTNSGLAGMASRDNGAGAEAIFNYIAIGIGVVAAAVTDTALASEITSNGGQRTIGAATRVTTSVTNDTAQLVNTFTFTGAFTVTESGIFNAASAGTLKCRQVIGGVSVVSGDSLQIIWQTKAS